MSVKNAIKTMLKTIKQTDQRDRVRKQKENRTTSCAFMIANAASDDRRTSIALVILAFAARCSAVNLDWIENGNK